MNVPQGHHVFAEERHGKRLQRVDGKVLGGPDKATAAAEVGSPAGMLLGPISLGSAAFGENVERVEQEQGQRNERRVPELPGPME
jgi:hypothetical protein